MFVAVIKSPLQITNKWGSYPTAGLKKTLDEMRTAKELKKQRGTSLEKFLQLPCKRAIQNS